MREGEAFPNGRSDVDNRATALISKGIEELAYAIKHPDKSDTNDPSEFDVIIIGTGYGGSVAAYECANRQKKDGTKVRVCVLERGDEKLPGAFPETFAELPAHVRHSNEGKETSYGALNGLFDFKIDKDVCALVANGLGGGSLINAGVMVRPYPSVFRRPHWPKEIESIAMLEPSYQKVIKLLGVQNSGLLPEYRQPSNQSDSDQIENNSDSRATANKYTALQALAGTRVVKPVDLTIQVGPSEQQAGVGDVKLNQCIGCGNCATGCNYGAKRSLDTTLLASAAKREGVQIFTGATVERFSKSDNQDYPWVIEISYTDDLLRSRMGFKIKLRCSKLIVAAGAYGSTELLLRSQAKSDGKLKFSERLGHRFSTNGDTIVALNSPKLKSKTASPENLRPISRKVGPSISGMMRVYSSSRGQGEADSTPPILVQNLAAPSSLHTVLAEALATSRTAQSLFDWKAAREPDSDPLMSVRPSEGAEMLLLAAMGDDGSSGVLALQERKDKKEGSKVDPERPVVARWGSGQKATRKRESLYRHQVRSLRDMAKEVDPSAEILLNPLRDPFADALDQGLEPWLGPSFTVHPLGGCPMGDSPSQGVVDDKGRVFDLSSTDVGPDGVASTHNGLIVLDGSVIPTALAANPALTIAAVALRAIEQLADCWEWKILDAMPQSKSKEKPQPRPVYRAIDPETTPLATTSTTLRLAERLRGVTSLLIDGMPKKYVVELTIRSQHASAVDIVFSKSRRLELDDSRQHDPGIRAPMPSQLRIYDYDDWCDLKDPQRLLEKRTNSRSAQKEWHADMLAAEKDRERVYKEKALISAPVAGHIELFSEVRRNCVWRVLSASYGLVRNTRFRPLQGLTTLLKVFNPAGGFANLRPAMEKWLALLAHAGRVREFSYHLRVSGPIKVRLSKDKGEVDPRAKHLFDHFDASSQIVAVKTLQYLPRSNPWQQLQEAKLRTFPLLSRYGERQLDVSPEYFSYTNVPLYEIVKQKSQQDGLRDLMSFYLHPLRTVVMHHFLSFRDSAPSDQVSKMPESEAEKRKVECDRKKIEEEKRRKRTPDADLHGLKSGSFKYSPYQYFTGDELIESTSPRTELKRFLRNYRLVGPRSNAPSVLMIHGYSASGTTFAHDITKSSLASYMVKQGFDVWVLDMSSSSASLTADRAQKFYSLAQRDISAAILAVASQAHRQKVDVVAHCMGAAMLSIAILGEERDGDVDEEINFGPQKLKDRSNSSLLNSVQVRKCINRIVLSQAGPFMKFSSDNIFRSYVLSYLREWLPLDEFQFEPKDPTASREKLIDRLLNTLPYRDKQEYALEDPLFGSADYTRMRHRMDALYGCTFKLANMDRAILDNLNRFFGTINFDVLAQSLPISRNGQICGYRGRPINISPTNLESKWTFKTLWVHGADNGLVSPISPLLTAAKFDQAGIGELLEVKIFDDMGHQDSLLGLNAYRTYSKIDSFFKSK